MGDLEKKKFEALTEAEMEQILDEEVAAGIAEVTIVNGEKKYRLTKKGMRYVEEKLLPKIGVPTGAQIIDQAKKGGR